MLTPRIWKPEGLIGTPLGTGPNCSPAMIGRRAIPTPRAARAPSADRHRGRERRAPAAATAAAAATSALAATAAAAMTNQPTAARQPSTTNAQNLGNRTTARPVAPGPAPGPARVAATAVFEKPTPTFPPPPFIKSASTNDTDREVMHYDHDVRRSSAEVVTVDRATTSSESSYEH